jgi:putative transposase
VDQDGFVLDILVQERRNEQAAVAFLGRVLAAAGSAPRVIVTDKLTSLCTGYPTRAADDRAPTP